MRFYLQSSDDKKSNFTHPNMDVNVLDTQPHNQFDSMIEEKQRNLCKKRFFLHKYPTSLYYTLETTTSFKYYGAGLANIECNLDFEEYNILYERKLVTIEP